MAARRFVMALVLALCGAPAVAYRDSLDLRSQDDLEVKASAAALAARAGAAAGGKVGDSTVGDAKLDLTLRRKEDGEEEGEEDTGTEGTRCVCLRNEDTVYENGEELTVNFAHMESQSGDCSSCSSTCNRDLAYRFGPAEAEAVGVEDASFPVRASSCDDGACSCLKARDATKTLEHYITEGNGGYKGKDIVKVEGKHNTEQECYSECNCDNEHSRLCVEAWSWGKFIENDGGSSSEGAVGPTSNSLTQTFGLSGGSGTYTAELVTAVEIVANGEEQSELVHEIDSQVMTVTFKAESESYNVKVGFEVSSEGGSGTDWTVEKRKNFAKLGWAVTELNGQGSFSIKKKNAGLWKVKRGKADRYFAQFETTDSNGWEIMFYQDDDTTQAGSLEKSGDSCQVQVEKGEDAGLIMIASVLMAEAYQKTC